MSVGTVPIIPIRFIYLRIVRKPLCNIVFLFKNRLICAIGDDFNLGFVVMYINDNILG